MFVINCEKILSTPNRFRFRYASYTSLGNTLPSTDTQPCNPETSVTLYSFETNIPALFGLDDMDRDSITPFTVSNRLVTCEKSPARW